MSTIVLEGELMADNMDNADNPESTDNLNASVDLNVPETEDYTDLRGMDTRAAKEYILAYITTLKNTQNDLRKAEESLSLWQSRVKLATERGSADLASAAAIRVDEFQTKVGSLKAEERKLSAEIEHMKSQLKDIQHQPEYTVDADLLLAQLEQVVGEPDKTAEKFKAEEADQALEELKKRLQQGES